MPPIKLFVQEQSEYGNPEAVREVATFATREEAVAAAQAHVDACLEEFYRPDLSAEDLIRQWSLFGEDVFLVPDEDAPRFSALEYVRLRCHELVQAGETCS